MGVAYRVGLVLVGVFPGVGVQQRSRHDGRDLLADLVGGGLVGLVGAGFARHGEDVDFALPCFDGVDQWLVWVCVVGECCDAVPFCCSLFRCFGDAF